MMTKSRRNNVIFSVVLVGLFLELFNKVLISPYTEYYAYYIVSTNLRSVLLVVTACAVYYVRGSLLLTLFMFFNLCAIFMNVMYLDPKNYYLIRDFRVSYFAPTYRAIEALILIRTGRNAGPYIYSNARHAVNWLCALATRLFVLNKGKKQ